MIPAQRFLEREKDRRTAHIAVAAENLARSGKIVFRKQCGDFSEHVLSASVSNQARDRLGSRPRVQLLDSFGGEARHRGMEKIAQLSATLLETDEVSRLRIVQGVE